MDATIVFHGLTAVFLAGVAIAGFRDATQQRQLIKDAQRLHMETLTQIAENRHADLARMLEAQRKVIDEMNQRQTRMAVQVHRNTLAERITPVDHHLLKSPVRRSER